MEWFSKHIRYFIFGALIAPLSILVTRMSSGPYADASPPPSVVMGAQITTAPSPTITQTPTPTETPTPRPTRKPTATPTTQPTPYPMTSEQLESWFTQYSNHYSIERKKLWLMAVCESGLKPNARNGIYGGLYQFSGSTWRSTRIRMNQDPDPQLRFNPEEAIKTAAFKISTSGLAAWPNCQKAQ